MEPLQVFDSFKLNVLNQVWVKSVWDGEFLIVDDLPDEYLLHLDSEDMGVLLTDAHTVVKTWMSENLDSNQLERCQRPEVSWQTLTALNINSHSLLAVLAYLMKSGQSSMADEDSRLSCLKATSLYFMLLAVPGSNAFHVFHPNLYHKAMETFKLSKHLTAKPVKRIQTTDLDNFYMQDEENISTLLNLEKITLVKGLNSTMYDLIMMLKTFCMRDQLRSLEITVHSLLEITKLETSINHFVAGNKNMDASITSLSYNAYVALQELCNPRHGAIDVTVRLISKYVLPHLLLNYVELPAKALMVIRDTTVDFLKNLLSTHEKQAELGITILIQHLMVKCPERVEARQKQAAVITKLMNLCKGNMYNSIIDDLILLAYHNKVSYRIFAQEIMGKVVLDNSNKLLNSKVKNLLIATTLSRCIDTSNMVRGKAMAIFAECINVENDKNGTIVNDIFKISNEDKPFLPVEELRRALAEDINPLPGSNTIMKMLMHRVEDERALVRRSALQILQDLVTAFPVLLDKIIPATGLRCRDPALSVRRYAVQVLTNILEKFYGHPNLVKEWVQAVLPQVFDIEIKVQEKVLEALQDMMLSKITPYSDDYEETADCLPWKILYYVTRMKMRKHLSKACSVWAQTKVITRSLIADVQSHIGTDNNLSAWILLEAFSQYKILPNMNLHFANYKELLSQDNFYANLVLEVLRNTWSSLDNEFLKKLHSDLLDSLWHFKVHFASVGLCLDIIGTILKHLNPDNANQLLQMSGSQLMKLSENEIKKIHDNNNTAEVAITCLRAMCTIGHASALCTDTISPSCLRTLQGLLLEWDSFPARLKNAKELRPAAITLLGQQAMRNREIAQEVTPILGKLMCQTTEGSSKVEAAIRVNSAKALADLCIRFTALVEPYLPDMCVSMKDPNPVVREVIVVLFIQLLLEDFIRVKGLFFFHILTMLSDTDETIRELTIFLIKERLLVKNKTLISQQFLQSIFHYNNYQDMNKFRTRRMREREKIALTLPGQRNQAKRRAIYNFMLEHLDPPGKLKLYVRLTNEVLAAVLNGSIHTKQEEGISVLKDALYIISREQLQPMASVKHTEDDVLDESTSPGNNSPSNALNIIVEEMKRHGLEVLLPILIKLKRKLKNSLPSVIADVTRLFIKVVSEYSKDKLSNLISEYPDLEKQIDQDIRQYGKKTKSDDEHTDEEECSSPSQPSPSNIASLSSKLLDPNRTPRIVIRRLSSLTYPGIPNLRSPPQNLYTNEQPGPSGNVQILTPTSATSANTLLFNAGPSCSSSPKSSRMDRSFRLCRYSPISPMRDKRLSVIFDDPDLVSNSMNTALSKSPGQRVQGENDSD
ncbi:condensin-2 complex subunit D3 [Cephus cinctus]|uniref:Condensin-2 complex subunit D3 n=1 Tax=Cephus cinctus TaxID=211228 RepID=A0AAJ7C5H0_CEPCN|nr:condensin-2 complex subunit D3 [Cephus cinctus]